MIFIRIQNIVIPKYPDDTILSNFDRDYREFYELKENSIDLHNQ